MTTYTTWPDDIPQSPLAGGFSGSPQPSLDAFEPEIGPPITARRSSTFLEVYSVSFPVMTTAQFASFTTWFEDELYSGVNLFYWIHPHDASTYLWRFADTSSPYQVEMVMGGMFAVSCKLMKVSTVAIAGPSAIPALAIYDRASSAILDRAGAYIEARV